MTIDVFDKQNNKVDTLELPDRIFNVKWNSALVHQVLVAQLSSQHYPFAHAKGRSEVRGGGKKPWKQKGTGRARHGSIRSPIWKGGGVTFGPNKERNFVKKINKKMKRLAIFNVLSKKIKDNEIKVVDNFGIGLNKTGEWNKILKKITDLKSKILLIPAASNNIHRAINNIKNIDAISPKSLNVYDLLKAKNIILEKKAISEIEKHYKA